MVGNAANVVVSIGTTDATDSDGSVDKLGTLKGVYLPCLQNILGVILFLRLPWIAGQAGTILSSVVVAMCVLSTVLTCMSLSALATNGKVGGGGPYYILSRNLGVEIGGAVGTLFYLGTTIAASMYILGAVEAFQIGFKMRATELMVPQALGLAAVMGSVVYIGVKYVNMSAMFFLAVVLLSIFSLSLGMILFAADGFDNLALNDWPGNSVWADTRAKVNITARIMGDNLGSSFDPDKDTGVTPSFWSMLALFYPSVTGIMAGTNRSAVLQNPGKSIPVGTLAAIITTTTLYFLTIWLFGSCISNEALKDDKLIVAAVAWPHPIIVQCGIVLSCVGAGLQSLTSASFLLDTILLDGVYPYERFATGGEPKKTVIITWFIASLPCLAGNLDYITPVITMFFLTMYTTINFCCFFLSYLKQPSFRPTWKYFHWGQALFGGIWCLAMMFMIDVPMAVIAIILAFVLMIYIGNNADEKEWGDSRHGFHFAMAMKHLTSIKPADQPHPKHWRPQLLVFAKTNQAGEAKRPALLQLGGQMKKGRGLMMVHSLLQDDEVDLTYDEKYYKDDKHMTKETWDKSSKAGQLKKKMDPATRKLQQYLDNYAIRGFAQVSAWEDEQVGLRGLLRTSGIGEFSSNSILMGWPHNWKTSPNVGQQFIEFTEIASDSDKSVMVLKEDVATNFPSLPLDNAPIEAKDEVHGKNATIDIWWMEHYGGLVLMLPYLLQCNKVWKNCRLRVFAVVSAEEMLGQGGVKVQKEKEIKNYCDTMRINIADSDIKVVTIPGGAEFSKEFAAIANQRTLDTEARQVFQAAMKKKPAASIDVRAAIPFASSGAESPNSKGAETEAPPADNSAVKQTHVLAVKMQELMNEHSIAAKLVIMTLPVLKTFQGSAVAYMEYVENVTKDLKNVLMVRGVKDKKVVTGMG